MNITFLVGNGFDISAGIDTSYSAFYEWYCNQDSDVKEHVKQFKKEIKEDLNKPKEIRNWADFELGLGMYTNKFNQDTLSQFWDCYEDAMLKLHEYIEIQMRQVSTAISSEEKNKFCKSLLEISDELADAESADISKMLPGRANQDVRYQFISFNYTSILDNFVKAASSQSLASWSIAGKGYSAKVAPKVLHVHGQLNNNPLMGVGHKLQIANQNLREAFQQNLLKSMAAEALGDLSQEKAKKCIHESDIVCLWGLSLGETDSQWWETIMEWLGEKESNRLIIYWYTGGEVTRRLHTQFLREKEKLCNKLFGYSCFTNEQMHEMRKRIYIVFDTKRMLRISLPKNRKLETATI